ncbi:hypothetical protein LCGC14_1585650 [marine sediment metagenome]|uniref:CARDB domain-containing protein n=1 Tax=marine sediment metagenome TaxID=412755 RepID=A0A0F9IFS2_9ZZZZ
MQKTVAGAKALGLGVLLWSCGEATDPEVLPDAILLPDLVPITVEAPELVSPERQLNIRFTYKNQGEATAPASGIHRVLLSSDRQESLDDAVVGTADAQALGPGATASAEVSYGIPGEFTEGAYFVIVVLDATRLVEESIEDNNAASATTGTAIQRGPDLAVDHFAIRSGIGTWYGNRGFYVAVDFMVSNNGTAPAPDGYWYDAYLSQDTILSADDIGYSGGCCSPVGQMIVGNESYFYDHNSIEPGTYWGILRVMPEDTVSTPELDPSDNVRRAIVTIPSLN